MFIAIEDAVTSIKFANLSQRELHDAHWVTSGRRRYRDVHAAE